MSGSGEGGAGQLLSVEAVGCLLGGVLADGEGIWDCLGSVTAGMSAIGSTTSTELRGEGLTNSRWESKPVWYRYFSLKSKVVTGMVGDLCRGSSSPHSIPGAKMRAARVKASMMVAALRRKAPTNTTVQSLSMSHAAVSSSKAEVCLDFRTLGLGSERRSLPTVAGLGGRPSAGEGRDLVGQLPPPSFRPGQIQCVREPFDAAVGIRNG